MSMKVRLHLRARLTDGSRPYLDPVYQDNGKLRPLYALLNGAPQKFADGIYYLRFVVDGTPKWKAVGSSAPQATLKKLQQEQILAGKASGLFLAEHREHERPPRREREAGQKWETGFSPKDTWATIETYLQDTSKYKRLRTYVTYKKALESFRASCSKKFLHQIDRRDLLDYVDELKKIGNGRRTVANKVKHVLIFLRKQGFRDVLPRSDIPKYTEKIVKAYQPEPLTTLFAAADWEDLMLFHFFLGGGARDNEVAHAGFHDIDVNLKTYDVREQPDFPKFEVKDFEERVVPLTDALIEMLCEHRKRHPTARLLFPRADGTPDHHLIRRLKALALKAGLNCGRCVKKNKKTGELKTCDQFPVCKEWTLHRFRKTFATMHSEAGVRLETISGWLGHADLETTKAYLEVGEASSKKTRQQVNQSFQWLEARSA
jgi:integrase/recombinase XerD